MLLAQYRDGPVTVSDYGGLDNPLVTQQDFSPQLIHLYSDGTITSPELAKLAEARPTDLANISCGVAASITCVRSIGIDAGWNQLPNRTTGGHFFTELFKYHGRPSSNPETREVYPKGWLVFSNTEKDISEWNIYHHAVGFYWSNLFRRKINTIGIRQLTNVEALIPFLNAGGKVMISVSNDIITDEQKGGYADLEKGSHLISIIGVSEDGKDLMVADPYDARISSRMDRIPLWKSCNEVNKFLKPDSNNYGIAFSAKDSDVLNLLDEFSYPFAVPE